MQTFEAAAEEFSLNLSLAQRQAFEIYVAELTEWNRRINLTAIVEREQVLVKHFLDSLSLAPLVSPAASASLIDIGSGAGFPGLPLKIAFPALRVTLVEATRKKVDFLQHLITRLALSGVTALQGRAEDLGRDPAYREQYDYAVARAVADLPTLLEYLLPFVRRGGLAIAQKGVDVEAEIRRSERALGLLGGRLRETVPVQLPGLEPRHLIVVEKVSSTPPAYPRRAGVPERKPLV